MWMRDRQTDRQGQTDRDRDRDRGRVCVCVCQTDGQTNRHADRQTDRQTDKEKGPGGLNRNKRKGVHCVVACVISLTRKAYVFVQRLQNT